MNVYQYLVYAVAVLFTPLNGGSLPGHYEGLQPPTQSTESPSLQPQTPPSTPTFEPLVLPENAFTEREKLRKSRDTIEKFINGFSEIMAQTRDKESLDVHKLDHYMDTHVEALLLATMRDLHLGHDAYDLIEIREALCFKAPTVLGYEQQEINKEQTIEYVKSCMKTVDTQPQTKELFSRYHALLLQLNDADYWHTFLLSIAENYQTGGGCWLGVRNRCAISLAYVVDAHIKHLLSTLPEN
ncbi:MAG: hypothetical protein Q8K36_00080 [Alphaproteobacteria bacterium]|nr:hypothetical protein [Alphaproteobacteria bacterium]